MALHRNFLLIAKQGDLMGVLDDVKKEMNGSIEHFTAELRSLRTGRANPSILSKVTVEVYGAQMRMQELANVSTPDAQQLLIVPFDKSNAGAIGKAIEKANLGVQVIIEGNQVRLRVPPMTQDVRNEMIKEVKRRAEETKVAIRNHRRKYNDKTRQMKAAGELTEDELHRLEKSIQTLTDDFCKKCDETATAKEKELSVI